MAPPLATMNRNRSASWKRNPNRNVISESESQGDSDATTISESSTRRSQRRSQEPSRAPVNSKSSVTKRNDLISEIIGQNRKENETLRPERPERPQEKETMRLFSSQESSDDADGSCSKGLLLNKIKTLAMENAKLRKENAQLRNSFLLFDKLPDLLHKVEVLSGTIEGHQTATTSTATTSTANFVQKRVDIGGGVFVPECALRYIDHTKHQRLTTGLLALLFTKEELRQSSLTGKRCNIHKDVDPKRQLDGRKLEALVGYVMDKCSVQKTQVLKVIKAKLNYEDKAGKPKPPSLPKSKPPSLPKPPNDNRIEM